MRNAFITWDRDFGVNMRRAFYSKFHVLLFSLGGAPSDALRQKHPLKDAVVQRVAGPQLRSRNKKNLVRVGVFHFGARRETADINVTLIRSVRTRNEAGFIRHGNA